MDSPLSFKKDGFGIDISDQSIKIVGLKKGKNGLSLAFFGERQIANGLIEAGMIKDEEKVASVIRDMLKAVSGKKPKTNRVISSLPEGKAFFQVIQIPKMSDLELKKAVPLEAENYIPMPAEEMVLGFQAIKPFVDHLDHLDVLIAAIPLAVANSYVLVLRKAGLKPLAMEVESQAIVRAIIKKEQSPFPVLLIDLGAVRTSFIIFSGRSLRFTSSIPISSLKMTEVIAKNLNIGQKEAEELKINYGLSVPKDQVGKSVFDSLIPSASALVEQIKICINYYQTHSEHEHLLPGVVGLEKIILCGGGANLKGLDDFLVQELCLPVIVGNPWVNVLSEEAVEIPALPYQKSLAYTTAIGLAMASFQKYD